MIPFPLDNTEYEAQALGAWCGTRTRGVYASDNHYSVTANDDMTVTVSPGLGWLKRDEYWGVNAFEPNAQSLTIDTADGSLARYAAICIQLDKNLNTCGVVVKYGPYGTNPAISSLPLPAQDSLDYDEIYVAAIFIGAGATSITAADITDLRLNETYCGIMRDGVTGIPTQALYDQWAAWMTEFSDEAQAYYGTYQNMLADLYTQYAATIATREADALTAYDAYVDLMTDYENTSKADFEAWVETIKDILDSETAGNLQLEIEALQQRTPSDVIGTVNTEAATPQIYPMCALYKSSWAFGMGGAGVGPAGGTSTVAIAADYVFDGAHNVTVTAPAEFQAFTDINQLSDTMFAFMETDPTVYESLVLRIIKEAS